MSTTIIGFPRLGEFRELKFTTEKYFRHEISAEELLGRPRGCVLSTGILLRKKGFQRFRQMTFLIMTMYWMRPFSLTWCRHLCKPWS
ncbi:hypothetical protein ACWLOB_02430 [Streptococcus sanguinis]